MAVEEPTMLRAVDADTHIFESPQVWDFTRSHTFREHAA